VTGIVARGILLLVIVVGGLESVAHAGTSTANRGKAIFQEIDRRNSGYQDLQVDLKMILRNSLGAESERLLSISMLEVPAGGDKLLIVFDTPKAIKGTALLSVGHPVEPDDQWLYLPALSRVKKIASRNKSGPFLGSEFAFEDLATAEVEKYDYRYLRDEDLDGTPCFVVERIPRDEYSGYTRQIVWVDHDYRVRKIDYYDRKESLLKTLAVSDFKLYENRFWKGRRMFMDNHETGKTTELLWSDFRFDVGLVDDRDFSTNSLKRAR
jgi:outer membrane lipoprotein-sorting protein